MPTRGYSFTGGWQSFDVPEKVEWLDVEVSGAGSGSTKGGLVSGKMKVRPKSRIFILVGEKGTLGGGQTVGGGGAAGTGDASTGWSGGGATIIRANSTTGAVRAVAGGAGGSSGDDGEGGLGGGDVGEAGARGTTDAAGVIGMATGGTQIQGGEGGRSSLLDDLNGADADDTNLSRGGAGGSSTRVGSIGGGGGGGGYHGGGGGVAGLAGEHPGGGGGAGSNFIGGLTGYQNRQGEGRSSNGYVSVSWVKPAPANQPPTPPSQVKVGGDDYSDGMATMSKGHVKVSAVLNDPNTEKKLRLVCYYSPDSTFRQSKVRTSDAVDRGKRADVELEGLAPDTLWHLRLYAKDPAGLLSTNFTSVNFWTDRPPNAPDPTSPGENATITEVDAVVFQWHHTDPDEPDTPHQGKFNLQWRRAGNAVVKPGEWVEVTFTTGDNTYVGQRSAFKSNCYYEWRVRTADQQGLWGDFSPVQSFYVHGSSSPPWLDSPVRDEALDLAEDVVFTWRYRDPTKGASQTTADLRYRAVGASDWVTIFGDSTTPGPMTSLAVTDLEPGRYEWQVRTYSTARSQASEWSDSEFFYTVLTPGSTTEAVVPERVTISERLGVGHNRVTIYRKGGDIFCGEVTPLVTVQWTRRRDDIGNAIITSNGFGYDCAQLLRDVHTWTHEVVIWRDGVRVWEGPITRLADQSSGFYIEAKDVMAYPYRRIMRQGYNDAYRVVNNVQLGQTTVVRRSRQILMNALAPDDPNLLQHLTTFEFHDDATQSRSVPDYSKTAWEEIDSMAATAGLDYTAVGRRIILWGTHRPIGRLPEMRSEHFSDPPVISEYGMLLATDYAVTNNGGVYAVATKRPDGELGPYGLVEQLVSAFGETESTTPADALTREQTANLERTLQVQAELGIASRWPTPLVVRVPDNSTLSPDAPVHINWLVPGVWIPLRAQGTVREVAQWQKLDSITVTEDKSGEKVSVVMSPAPNRGSDPDAEGDVETVT